jgi:tetratricopeptide (TPR) repeat protein
MGCAALAAAAQTSAPPLSVTVIVSNAIAQPPQPVKAVRVSLSYLESAVLITDAQQVTNTQGQALLVVSGNVAQQGSLRMEITGAGDLAIYQPADGQLAALPTTVKISLLPKGSAALLGPAQIEAMLHRMLLQVNSLQKQVSTLKAGAAQGQQSDLGAAIAGWAQANGFSSGQVDQQVQQWAAGIQKQSGQATAEQKALAELALKHYAAAAQLFNQASDADRQEIGAEDAEEQALQAQVEALEAAQQRLLDKQRSSLRQLLDHSEQAAGADQLNLKFHDATQTLESAVVTADAESKKHPGDKGFHELWLRAVFDTANALRKEGEVASADQSLPLLTQAAGELQSLANEYSALEDRPEFAAAQGGLGMALVREGERAGGDKASALFDQAVQAFQKALEVRTKTYLPQDWAQTEMNLGVALQAEGERAGGDKAMDLFDQAVQAYKNALEIYTKANLPLNWAWTEHDLGVALDDEGDRASGDQAAALLDQAVQAYRSALEIQTKADLPQDWARTQMNLGNALDDEGERATGDKAMALFNQAVEAYRNALQVYTRADLPQSWAVIELNIMEADFVSSHFEDCFRNAEILTDDVLWGSLDYSRDAMRFACAVAAGQHAAARDALKVLSAKAPAVKNSAYDYSGILRFLSNSPAFANGRASWIALFTAVQNGDSAGMTAALHQLEPLLQQ